MDAVTLAHLGDKLAVCTVGVGDEIVIKINKRPRLKLGFSTQVAEFFKFIA